MLARPAHKAIHLNAVGFAQVWGGQGKKSLRDSAHAIATLAVLRRILPAPQRRGPLLMVCPPVRASVSRNDLLGWAGAKSYGLGLGPGAATAREPQ